MDSAKNQLVDKIKSANNILVTVSRNPSVDQLAACIGLTLVLNKLDKHATAVFSGQVPSTMEFLQPEETLEKNTDSLRDFIIALDKSKADKLRYKVEDEMVRIFITPYRTSISEADLDFSQGDFNVDLVVALGVHQQEDLDEAIISHGRILHDATVSTINTDNNSDLGSINWNDPAASSLAELVADLTRLLGSNLLDGQIATAILTGIVAETARFSNDKTTSQTMSVSAELMAAGANQQLVASKLDEPPAPTDNSDTQDPNGGGQGQGGDQPDTPAPVDGELDIEHQEDADKPQEPTAEPAQPVDIPPADNPEPSHTDPEENEAEAVLRAADALSAGELPSVSDVRESPSSLPIENVAEPQAPEPAAAEAAAPDYSTGGSVLPKAPKFLTDEPIVKNSSLTANFEAEGTEMPTDPLSAPDINIPGLLTHDAPHDESTPAADSASPATPAEPVADLTLPEVKPEAAAEPTTPSHSDPDQLMTGFTPPPPAWVPPSDDAFDFLKDAEPGHTPEPGQTLSDIELSVHSPHLESTGVDNARDEVAKALNSADATPGPIQALNAQPMFDNLHPDDQAPLLQPSPGFGDAPLPPAPAVPGAEFVETTPELKPLPTLPTVNLPAPPPVPGTAPAAADDATAPPIVPPPLPFSFGTPGSPPPAQ